MLEEITAKEYVSGHSSVLDDLWNNGNATQDRPLLGLGVDDIMMRENDNFFHFTINPKVLDAILLKTMEVYAIHCNVKYEKIANPWLIL